MKKDKIFIYGKHVLDEALNNCPDIIEKVFLSENVISDSTKDKLKACKIPFSDISLKKEIPTDIEKDASHQGVFAKISLEKLLVPFESFISDIVPTKNASLVLLSGVQDPQNMGTIIRSSVAFGVSAVLIPTKSQSPITASVVKTSVGMVFRTKIVLVEDVQLALSLLKKRGFFVYGMDGDSENSIKNEKIVFPSVFVFGNESVGIEKNIFNVCDKILSIPMEDGCESLNVAASAAIVLYEQYKQK